MTDFQNFFYAGSDEISKKTCLKCPPHLHCVATSHCEMQVPKWHKLCMNYNNVLPCLKFYTCSISYRHWHIICSKCPSLTGIHAHRCVCHWLIADSYLSFSRTALSLTHTAHNTVWFMEQATSEFISSHKTTPTLIQWSTLSVGTSKCEQML